MRYELTDLEWSIIHPVLPTKSRGVPRVDDRLVLNGIFWVLRSGAPWRDLPECYGPYTTCYNRFNRWRRAGIWDNILAAVTDRRDADVQMLDTSIVRVHQHASCVTECESNCTGRSRGGLTTKIHAVVDAKGLPLRLALSAGQDHDSLLAGDLLTELRYNGMLLADRAYDSDSIRELARERGAWANIPPKRNRRTRSASARICTESAIMWSASSIASSTVGASPAGTTSWQRTSSRSSSSQQSAFGWAFMSPRPSALLCCWETCE